MRLHFFKIFFVLTNAMLFLHCENAETLVNNPSEKSANEDEEIKVTITFDKTEGNGTMYSLTEAPNAQVTLPNNLFSNTGFLFNGWAETVNGEVVAYDGDQYTMPTENKTLYATWVKSTISKISVGLNHTLILRSNNSLWSVGKNDTGKLGDGSTVDKLLPVKIIPSGVKDISAAKDYSLFLKDDGSAWVMGDEDGPVKTKHNSKTEPVKLINSGVKKIKACLKNSFYIKDDNTLWGMGNIDGLGEFDSMGNDINDMDTDNDYWINTPIMLMENVQSVSCPSHEGFEATIVLKQNSDVLAVGEVPGLLFRDFYSDFYKIRSITDVNQIYSGMYNHYFLKNDNSLWAGGFNYKGEFGNNNTIPTNLNPIQIVSSEVSHLAAGAGHNLFIKTDGSVWGMGDNSKGQLGNGTTTDSKIPVKIFDSGVTQIYASKWVSFFVKEDGSLWSSGYNNSGMMGDGRSGNEYSTPIETQWR